MGIFNWLFGTAPVSAPEPLHEEPRRKRSSRKPPTKAPKLSFTLVEATFDPDGDKSDFEWSGFHIHNERGVGVDYSAAEEFGLQVFRVAGVTYRSDPLQRAEFEPGSVLKLVAENDNQYDRNAVAVWDRYGTWMVGYVPKERNERIRAAMQLPGHAALALAEHRKGDKRVSLTVLFGPLEVKS
jgi:hypothetical protein